jgi:hypothetical protein
VTFPINFHEETAGGVGNFDNRSHGKSIRSKGISLNDGDRFCEDHIHGMGEARLGPKLREREVGRGCSDLPTICLPAVVSAQNPVPELIRLSIPTRAAFFQ